MINDVEISTIRSAQRGSEEAWLKLFEWHFEPVFHYCLTLTNGRQDLAEDITQQVFMTAAVRINKFRPQRGTFRAWLLGIAKNGFKKYRLKEQRHKKYESQVSKSLQQQKNQQPEILVHEVLAKLPIHYRSVLEAKYLHGLKVDEIAEANRSTSKAVESLLGRAREKFAQVSRQIQNEYMK